MSPTVDFYGMLSSNCVKDSRNMFRVVLPLTRLKLCAVPGPNISFYDELRLFSIALN